MSAGYSGKGGPGKGDSRNSSPQGTSTGSGSRPGTKSKFPIDTSNPVDNKNLGGRGSVPGALK